MTDANKFFVQLAPKKIPIRRSFHISLFDTLSKKQIQIDVARPYLSFITMTKEEFDEEMVREFRQLLKAVVI
jgi:hypothetical protein